MPPRKVYPPELSAAEVAEISPLYNSFVHFFSAADAQQVLNAGAHNKDRLRKTDYFADCIVIAVAYDCFTDYLKTHGFESETSAYMSWIKEHVDFDEYKYSDETAEKPYDMVENYRKKFADLI